MSRIYKYENNFEFIRCNNNYTTEITGGLCTACGGLGPYEFVEIISNELMFQWGLSSDDRRAMSSRESMFCAFCGCSQRLRSLAQAITLTISENHLETKSLKELIADEKLNELNIAEINSCGELHNILSSIPHLDYSEYESRNKEVRHEDLMNLSYKDQVFDIVLTSDTLEHVPDPKKALQETYRVLRNGGHHIFTVPAFLDRPSRQRVKKVKGEQVYLETNSYHGSGEPDYLVWNEFGQDFLDLIMSVGFDLKVYFVNLALFKDPSYVFVAKRPVDSTSDLIQGREIFVDPSVPLEYNPKKHLKNRSVVNLSTIAPSINTELQISSVEKLVEKIKLSNSHIKNLEDIIEGNKEYIKKLGLDIGILNTHIKNQNKELYKSGNSRSRRAVQRVKKIHKGK